MTPSCCRSARDDERFGAEHESAVSTAPQYRPLYADAGTSKYPQRLPGILMISEHLISCQAPSFEGFHQLFVYFAKIVI